MAKETEIRSFVGYVARKGLYALCYILYSVHYFCYVPELNHCSAGALLKAALICAKVVDFPSDISLKVQLQNKYSSGFEMETWSNLPHGSGLSHQLRLRLCPLICCIHTVVFSRLGRFTICTELNWEFS